MKAVFLDRNTFSPDIDLPAPAGVTDWQVYAATRPEEVAPRLQDADIVISNKVVIDAAILSQCPQLKLVQVAATGTNNVDHDACQKSGVKVMNVAGYSTTSVTEHTFMLMLSAMRGLLDYHHAVTSGKWQQDGRFCLNELPLFDLEGKTLGIVGTGEIGKRVTEIARAFGMEVLWAERRGKSPRSAEYTPFEDVFAHSDVISLHCPLTPETNHLINQETLAFCQKKPLLINVARGAVVDSAAVVAALENNILGGFASDVFIAEPPAADEPLLKLKQHPRVLFTPHHAWASVAAQKKLWEILSKQITAFIDEDKK